MTKIKAMLGNLNAFKWNKENARSSLSSTWPETTGLFISPHFRIAVMHRSRAGIRMLELPLPTLAVPASYQGKTVILLPVPNTPRCVSSRWAFPWGWHSSGVGWDSTLSGRVPWMLWETWCLERGFIFQSRTERNVAILFRPSHRLPGFSKKGSAKKTGIV